MTYEQSIAALSRKSTCNTNKFFVQRISEHYSKYDVKNLFREHEEFICCSYADGYNEILNDFYMIRDELKKFHPAFQKKNKTTKLEVVKMYRTIDGKLFENKDDAKQHNGSIKFGQLVDYIVDQCPFIDKLDVNLLTNALISSDKFQIVWKNENE